MIEYKGYTGMVDYDPALRCFSGHVIDLRDEIYFEGASVEELEASMRRAVDHYLAVCAKRGEEPERPFSGKLNLRLGPDLHRTAALAAAAAGESLNNWLVRVVESAARSAGRAPPRQRASRSTADSPRRKTQRKAGK
jgi:predicted HicB family RNase H-like nuclease